MAAVMSAPRAFRRVTFGLAGRSLAVDVDDAAALHVLETTYARVRVPEAKSANHTASLQRLSDGRLHVRFDRCGLAAGDAAAGGPNAPLLSAYYAAKEVFARFAAAQPSAVAFYGALVAIGGGAVLILGPTAIGKTVLSLNLSALGATFLGDETAVLDLRSGNVCALARTPALRESALDFLPSIEMRARVSESAHVLQTERGRFWYALGSHDLAGIAPSDRAYRLRAVCVIRERSQTGAIRRMEIAQALPALMQRAYARPSELTELSRLRRAMRNVAGFEMSLSHPRGCAAELFEQVRTSCA